MVIFKKLAPKQEVTYLFRDQNTVPAAYLPKIRARKKARYLAFVDSNNKLKASHNNVRLICPVRSYESPNADFKPMS